MNTILVLIIVALIPVEILVAKKATTRRTALFLFVFAAQLAATVAFSFINS